MGKKKPKRVHEGNTADKVTGVIRKLFHSSAGFSAGSLMTAEGDDVRFAGPVFFDVDAFVTLFGGWVEDERWGKQFKAAGFEFAGAGTSELDADGLAHYLAVSKEFRGIGHHKAQIIADAFGSEFGTALEEKIEEIARVAGLKLPAVLEIREVWRKNSSRNGTMTWLAKFGLTAHQINSIVDAYGNNTVKILTEDPYRMIEVIDGFGFARVDEIAQKMGIAKNHPSRIQAGIRQIVNKELDDGGHTWTDRPELVRLANILLALDDLDSLKQIEDQLTYLVRCQILAEDAHPQNPTVQLVAKPEMARMEYEIFQWIDAASTRANPVLAEFTGFGAILPSNHELNEDQRAAVTSALARQLVIITGGAGSGKTFSIQSIVEEYAKRSKDAIILCAPTGKAARRITESVGRTGATIHRTLGYRGQDDWMHSRRNPLAADLVVVDETSMVAVPLMHRLLQSIDWERTAVVLVGDPNQLPPIGAGNVLRDLINAPSVPTVRLNTVVRQAGELKQNCMAILDGEVPRPIRQRGDKPAAWYVMDKSDTGDMGDAEHVRDKLVAMVDQRLEHLQSPEGELFDLLRDVQILTPKHDGSLGTKQLNIALQRVYQRKLFNVTTEPVEDGKRPPFMVGDKIIQTKNDYDLDVMNGMIGYIKEIAEEAGSRIVGSGDLVEVARGDLLIDFDGEGVKVIPRKGSKQSNLMHAYALTVHKMQGSEVPCAIAITHKSHSFMQHQAMLYTAVTRARKTVIVMGDPWGIRQAAKNRLVEKRRTFLSLLFMPAAPF